MTEASDLNDRDAHSADDRTGLTVACEVADALAAGRPVIALESTIISHGLPRPRNLEVALSIESLARQQGVVPATIGVVAGQPIVGLSRTQIELLAGELEVAKVSIRELPLAAALGCHAATTVAATAHLAHIAGIRVFATGGIGGVHRGAAHTFDESADLGALATLPIAVVCAGVKSVLDVPATLERLETLGVAVVGFRTKRMPGFYVSDIGLDLEWSVSSAAEIAAVMASSDSLAVRGGIVVANPVPVDRQLDPALHDRVLAEALAAAERDGISGKAVTPYLLDAIALSSGGASLEANIAAVHNNVALACDIARAWSDRVRRPTGRGGRAT